MAKRRPELPVEVEVRLHPDVLLEPNGLLEAAARRARVPLRDVHGCTLLHRAIDARGGQVRVQARVRLRGRGDHEPIAPRPQPVVLPSLGTPEVVVVGAGPAGMFCAWALAQVDIASIVVERGKPVRERRHDLARLSQRGELDPESNYCFGEGGAGTFSDGKLYTRAQKRGPVRRVLEALVGYGAPEPILVDARPHIGTNRLPAVITAMREHLEDAGVRFRFSSKVTGLVREEGRATGVRLADGSAVDARAVVLATGHSARDVLSWLDDAGVALAPKSFAMGVRIEHPQSFVDRTQYGDLAGHPALGSASYRLVRQVGGCGVFSFCMCPGGFIVPAATVPGAQVVNGWSPSSRRGRFANSGFVTEVGPDQIAASGRVPTDVFAGLDFQSELESAAFAAGGGAFVAPAQRLDDFVAGRLSTSLPRCSYPRGLQSAPLHELLGFLAEPIQTALREVAGTMPGFLGPEAVAVGVESRTSSPVRIERDFETLESVGCSGLFPCGEGGGHAGGIMSAALDGIRVAEAVAKSQGRRIQLTAR